MLNLVNNQNGNEQQERTTQGCACCIMKENEDLDICGAPLPSNPHFDSKGQIARIIYDIYSEYFYMEILTPRRFGGMRRKALHPIEHCPNCGARLFDTFDAQAKVYATQGLDCCGRTVEFGHSGCSGQ